MEHTANPSRRLVTHFAGHAAKQANRIDKPDWLSAKQPSPTTAARENYIDLWTICSWPDHGIITRSTIRAVHTLCYAYAYTSIRDPIADMAHNIYQMI